MPKLVLRLGDKPLRELPLDKPELRIGRKADNDVVLDNPAVSSHHCRVVFQGETYYVEDLDSTNGTSVNGKRVLRCGLHPGDAIGIARYTLTFVEDSPAGGAKRPDAGGSPEPVAEEPSAGHPGAGAAPAADGQGAVLRVLKGKAGRTEYKLSGSSIYIGKSDRVQIPIAGAGLFKSAPEVAASVHHKPEGFVLVAVKPGYPTVNGKSVSGQVLLKDGDIIECGGTTMQFRLK